MLSSACICRADEVYTGGTTTNIDYEVLGYVWVEGATVNLYPGAHIVNDYYLGDVIAASGAIINIYGGQIDNLLIITTSYNGMPDPQVIVHGTDFAVDGTAVDPSAAQLFLTGHRLSGRYADGTSFAFGVDCFEEGSYQLTVGLHWIDAAPPEPQPQPKIEVSVSSIDLGRVEVGEFAQATFQIANTGAAPLVIDSLSLEQDSLLQFYTTGLWQSPLILAAEESVEIGVLFAPVEIWQAEAAIVLLSNDPEQERLAITLAGEGIVRLTPAQQIKSILEFFDRSVREGKLVGQGPRLLAALRLASLRQMIVTAQILIDRQQNSAAFLMLKAVKIKIDGECRPGDFVTGAAVGELKEKVSALMEDLKQQ